MITIHSEYHFILFQPVKSQLDSKIICGKNPRAEIGWPVLSVMIHLGTVVRITCYMHRRPRLPIPRTSWNIRSFSQTDLY